MIAAALEEDRTLWFEDAIATIRSLAMDAKNPEFTADDLRREMRSPASDKWPGLAFTAAKRAGIIESVASTTSTSRSRKNGSLKTWRGKINRPLGELEDLGEIA